LNWRQDKSCTMHEHEFIKKSGCIFSWWEKGENALYLPVVHMVYMTEALFHEEAMVLVWRPQCLLGIARLYPNKRDIQTVQTYQGNYTIQLVFLGHQPLPHSASTHNCQVNALDHSNIKMNMKIEPRMSTK
jgi:hypothetical protein